MTQIVAVHGIGQQQSGRHQMVAHWDRAMRDGVERALGRDGLAALELYFDLAFYGDLFLAPTSVPTKGPAEYSTLTEDDISYFVEIQDEVATEVPVTLPDKGVRELPPAVAKLATWLDRKFGAAGRVMFFGDLKQVRRYQDDDRLAQGIRDRVVEALRDGAEILVAHSLGSVVAYEVLCLTTDHTVQTLVTLGSPLALPSVARRLRDQSPPDTRVLPPGLTRWVNIYDPSDAVACAGGVSPIWPQVIDVTVNNERDPHSVYAYLGKEATGRAITDTTTASI